MIEFLSALQFKQFHVKRPRRAAAPLLGVRKEAIDKVEKLDERTLRFTISTAAVDRDLDKIDVAGWQLDNFARNPVVLWAHRADELPIGRAIDFGSDRQRLFSAVQFLPSGYGSASDLAETIYRMAADGYLSATSVGFRPITWDFTADKDRGGDDWFPGIDFHEQELVELSIVAVPSNPEALIETLIEPGDDGQNTAPALIPAPVQVVDYEIERRKRRARAARLGVF